MPLNFTKLAQDMRRAHDLGQPFRLPAMQMRELDVLFAMLDRSDSTQPTLH